MATTVCPHRFTPSEAGRFGIAGILAGLASLVPGISAGTMVLAAGVYPQLVGAVADLTALRFRWPSAGALLITLGAALAIIFLAAGTVRDAFSAWPTICFALFLGLTIGGAIPLWHLPEQRGGRFAAWAFVGILAVAVPLLLAEPDTAEAAIGFSSPGALFAAGVMAAFAMVLPGVSGSTLLVVTGMYLPYLNAVDRFTDSLGVRPWDIGLVFEAFVGCAPFFVGIGLGIAAAARLVRYLLTRFREPTLGVLFGLLLGALIGLWPFQTATGIRFFPSASGILAAVVAVMAGIALTLLLGATAPDARSRLIRGRTALRRRKQAR